MRTSLTPLVWLRHCINAAVHTSPVHVMQASKSLFALKSLLRSHLGLAGTLRSIAATGSWDGQRLRPSDIVMHSTQPEARATATLTMYRVRQKSKLLILSEYVNKSETIRGM